MKEQILFDTLLIITIISRKEEKKRGENVLYIFIEEKKERNPVELSDFYNYFRINKSCLLVTF